MDQAVNFHEKLMSSRVDRFEADLSLLQTKNISTSLKIKNIEKQRDLRIKDLDSSGALDEYNSIIERIRTLGSEINEIEKYQHIINDFDEKETELEFENTKLKKNALEYLKKPDTKQKKEFIENEFRGLVKEFYVDSGGTFEFKNTDNAAYVYDINVSIKRELSQGVNEVKIFCYDLLMYSLNKELLGFLAHDGCLFSEMDPRQKVKMFKVILDYTNNKDLQYFVNIGQSTFEEVLTEDNNSSVLSEKDKIQIKDSVILELYDKDPSEWLFGLEFA